MSYKKKRASTTGESTIKIILTGNSAVGKSCLIVRFSKGEFNQNYEVTVGIEFATKVVKIDENYKVRLTIWDTAGQQSFQSIIKMYYRNTSAVILVYDITNKESFDNLDHWLAQAKENSPKSTIYVLIGTHLDLQQQREVTKESAEEWVKANGIAIFFQTSSKTAENVNMAFEQVAKQVFYNIVLKKKENASSNEENSVLNISTQAQPDQIQQKKCCK